MQANEALDVRILNNRSYHLNERAALLLPELATMVTKNGEQSVVKCRKLYL